MQKVIKKKKKTGLQHFNFLKCSKENVFLVTQPGFNKCFSFSSKSVCIPLRT